MWWGYSPPLDLRREVRNEQDANSEEPLEILIVGSADARHIVKTLASSYQHDERPIKFHVIEPSLEQIARSILLLSTALEQRLGLQEATRYYLELMGNTLLRTASSKFLARRAHRLADIPTQSMECPWLDLTRLKHKERDLLESIFKFWGRAACEGVPIVEYWDRRVRKALGARYDYRDGVFDWDFHMVLKSRNVPNLTLYEYRFWRNNGVAFTWLEGEPARSNPTLLSNVTPHGAGFLHLAYMGDIAVGPYFTWGLAEENCTKKLRATDIAEREVMRAIHEIRTNEPICEEAVAAHRDPSILNGIIVTEMPDSGIEQESWTAGFKVRKCKDDIVWTSIPNIQVIFHPTVAIENYKNKAEFVEKFDLVWLAHNMTKQVPNLVPLAKRGATVLVESRKFMVELRQEELRKFTEDLRDSAKNNGLQELNEFDSEKHVLARFTRINV